MTVTASSLTIGFCFATARSFLKVTPTVTLSRTLSFRQVFSVLITVSLYFIRIGSVIVPFPSVCRSVSLFPFPVKINPTHSPLF
jgi:hypothetical protein